MADKRPVTLLTRPVGDYVGMYVTASLVPVRHFAIHALGFMWEFDQMGVVIYPCEDHHTDRRWACGHFVFTEWFMVGNCVVEEENLRNFVREWEAQNDYQHVVKNCQVLFLSPFSFLSSLFLSLFLFLYLCLCLCFCLSLSQSQTPK